MDIKTDVYFLNFVSRDFWRQIVTLFFTFKSSEHVPNTRIIQKTLSKHQAEGITTSEAFSYRCYAK